MAIFLMDLAETLGTNLIRILYARPPTQPAGAQPDPDDFDPKTWSGPLDPSDGLPPDHP